MKSQQRAIGTITIALIVGVVIVGALGVVWFTSQPYTYGGSTTVHNSNTTTMSSATNTTCLEEKSNGFALRAVQDNSAGQMNGVEVKASPTTLCNGVETVTAILLQAATNSSGLVQFGGFYGSYYKVTVTYSGQTYSYTAPMKTNETTFLTIHLPSGSFETNYQ